MIEVCTIWNKATVVFLFYETKRQSFAVLRFYETDWHNFALRSCHGPRWQIFELSSCHGPDCQRLTLQSMTSLKRLGTLVKGSSQAAFCLATLRLPVEHYKNWTRHLTFDDISSCRGWLIWTSQIASPLDKLLFEELTLQHVSGLRPQRCATLTMQHPSLATL